MSVVYKSKLRDIASGLEREVLEAIKETADEIADLAEQLAPFDTGELRASKRVSPQAGGWMVAFDAEYAAYVEYGTDKMDAQPYLTPAVEQVDKTARTKARLAALIARNTV